MKADVIIAAAGKGERLNLGFNKVLMRMAGKSVLYRSVKPFRSLPFVNKIIVSCAACDMESVAEELKEFDVITVLGGKTRSESVKNALVEVTAPFVLVHDGARPFVSAELIRRVAETTFEKGACVPVIPVIDTIKKVVDGKVEHTPLRSEYRSAQTPQGFCSELLKRAYTLEGNFSDDASAYELVADVYTTDGDENNIKITTSRDIENQRVGIGRDAHRLVEGRKLMLGGEHIPFDRGLLGHSDADVLIHAVCDSLLSAAGERDIGVHFPDTDPSYEGISGMKLLELTDGIIRARGFCAANVSAVIEAEKPKLAGYIPAMRRNIARVLGITEDDVTVNATTTEGLGFVGEGLGMQAFAYSTVRRIYPRQ